MMKFFNSFCSKKECEGSLSMNIQCRRGQLFAVLPLLCILSCIVNLSLLSSDEPAVPSFKQKSVFQKSETVVRVQPHDKEKPGDFDAVDNNPPLTDESSEDDPAMTLQEKKQTFEEIKRRRRKLRNQMKGRKRLQKMPFIEPKDQSLLPSANFSACLLIKDDNEILNEWIAYHYHTLKLRRLVVAVDPSSSESPSDILENWRRRTDLEVFQWDDKRYMPAAFLKSGKPPEVFMQEGSDFHYKMSKSALLEISIHRYRQRVFLAQCMRSLREMGSSWLIHIDTDEYAVPSKKLREEGSFHLTAPALDQPGAVLSLLQRAVKQNPTAVRYPCISMLRVLFGAVESPSEQGTSLGAPPGYNASSFETLRWRYHALPQNMSLNGNPKVIFDVSAIPRRYFPTDVVFSIHRPIEELCQRNKDLDYDKVRRQPVATNHYLGSWERYSGRQDQRRSRETYEAKAYWQREVDDGVRPWLKGFVDTMGDDLAHQLLGSQYMSRPAP